MYNEQEYERRRELFSYLDIPNTDQANISKKWFGLRTMGYTEEQCERECRPKELNIEKELEAVREMQKREMRELAKYNREQAKLRKKSKERESLKNCIIGQEIAPESFAGAVDEGAEDWVFENLGRWNDP